MALKAISWEDGKLKILDQLKLPFESKYLDVENTEKGWEVIHKMQVRGAPAIAIVGCLSLAAELTTTTQLEKYENNEALHSDIVKKINYLISARPTAVNMKKCGAELIEFSKFLSESDIPMNEYRKRIVDFCVQMLEDDVATNKLLSQCGCKELLKNVNVDLKLNVITHCNTGSLATAGYGTGLGVIRTLHSEKRLEHVYYTETRPYNQGSRLTAYELVHENIPATLICDSMVGALMKTINCHAVIVGADRIARNGDTANKIGTYQLAVLANAHKVPFYICAPKSSIDLTLNSGNDIPIEQRPPHEMTVLGGNRIAAHGINCWNPAFDITPASLITGGIITENGMFTPKNLVEGLTNSK